MATTTLIVEILIIGVTAEIWLLFLTTAVCSLDLIQVFDFFLTLKKSSILIIFPYSAMTYSLGWLSNFLSSKILKRLGQKQYREKKLADYYNVRGLFFQKAATEVIMDLRIDRHIIRISRSNIANFMLIAITSLWGLTPLSYCQRMAVFAFFILLAIASWFQWTSRYKTCYNKIINTYDRIKTENMNTLSQLNGRNNEQKRT